VQCSRSEIIDDGSGFSNGKSRISYPDPTKHSITDPDPNPIFELQIEKKHQNLSKFEFFLHK